MYFILNNETVITLECFNLRTNVVFRRIKELPEDDQVTPKHVVVLRMPSSGMWRRIHLMERRLTQYLHCATPQNTAFFIGTAVKTSNLICSNLIKI
jgi:hypothetical protein